MSVYVAETTQDGVTVRVSITVHAEAYYPDVDENAEFAVVESVRVLRKIHERREQEPF